MEERCAAQEGYRLEHFSLKVGCRDAILNTLINTLDMKVLRHEEFKEGCAASCNGGFGDSWSKTMVGYGAEADHFVLEITYTYGKTHYDHGNDVISVDIDIYCSEVWKKIQKKAGTPEGVDEAVVDFQGYRLVCTRRPTPSINKEKAVITGITLRSSDLERSKKFWAGRLGLLAPSPHMHMSEFRIEGSPGAVRFHEDDGIRVKHEEAFGRIALSCPESSLKGIEEDMKRTDNLHTELKSLETPGKTTVQVVILKDPEAYEICFVGVESFRKLSQVDPEAEKLLREAIAKKQNCSSCNKK